MKKFKTLLFIISAILLVLSLLFLVASMVVQAIFNSRDIAQYIEVIFAVVSIAFAFAGIVLACLSKKGNEVDKYDEEFR
ncbi:MAG: hypothetical protein ACI4RM_05655 [Ruminococcus sp.]